MKIKKLRKKIIYSVLVILLALSIWYFNLIIYGIRQGIGQVNILWNVQSFDSFLKNGDYPDSTKTFFKKKLALIEEIKRFAVDSLGLKNSANYSKIYDQKKKAILWAVSASEPYQLKPKMWNYAFLGDMPYQGYFDSTLAYNLVNELKKQDYDVSIYTPAGWSTLGWFTDPVLSSMLYWSEGDLASLIIHELTHSTIWLNGDVDYNENLADFVGDNGAILFLISKYGKNSKQYLEYQNGKTDSEKLFKHILSGAGKLDSLYQSFKPIYTKAQKDTLKYQMIRRIVQTADTVDLKSEKRIRSKKKYQTWQPNNAFFMSYRRYRSKQNEFEKEFKEKFNSNFKQYLAYLKEKYK